MEVLLVLGYVVIPAAALIASFAFSGDADSPMGDGMILGCLVLAVPLWPLTMTLWLLYMLKRHADAASVARPSVRTRKLAPSRPVTSASPARVSPWTAASDPRDPVIAWWDSLSDSNIERLAGILLSEGYEAYVKASWVRYRRFCQVHAVDLDVTGARFSSTLEDRGNRVYRTAHAGGQEG